MFEPNKRYDVVIKDAYPTQSSKKGTLGLAILLKSPGTGDEIYHTLWFAEGSIENAKKTLESIGISEADLRSKEFWENPASKMANIECSITTQEREFGGVAVVQVQWLNPRGSAHPQRSNDITQQLLRLFSPQKAEAFADLEKARKAKEEEEFMFP